MMTLIIQVKRLSLKMGSLMKKQDNKAKAMKKLMGNCPVS